MSTKPEIVADKVKPSRRHTFKNLLSSLGRNRKQAPAVPTSPQVAPAPLPSPTPAATQLKRTASTLSSSSGSSIDSANDVDASTHSIVPSSIKDKSTCDNASLASSGQNSRTNKSTASTKPTTLLSMGSDGGANRIAQSRHSGGSSFAEASSPVFARLGSSGPTHVRRDSANTTASQILPSSSSIQFSTLPGSSSAASTPTTVAEATQHAPFYTRHNPRDNPHPASPALDNASTLTLASSTGMGVNREGSLYHTTRIDENASIRALPPSRRESQSSLNSKYSAAVPISGAAVTAGFLRDGHRPASLRTVATTKSADLVSSRGDQRRSTATMEELSPTTAPISRPASFQALESPVEDRHKVTFQPDAAEERTGPGAKPVLQRAETDWDQLDMRTAPSTPVVDVPEPEYQAVLQDGEMTARPL